MSESTTTKRIEPLPPIRHHLRLARQLRDVLLEGDAEIVGEDIVDAITKLIASVRRRELEIVVQHLPDITGEAEAA